MGPLLGGRGQDGLVDPVERQRLAVVGFEAEPHPPHGLEHLVADGPDRGGVGIGEQAAAAPHGDLLHPPRHPGVPVEDVPVGVLAHAEAELQAPVPAGGHGTHLLGPGGIADARRWRRCRGSGGRTARRPAPAGPVDWPCRSPPSYWSWWVAGAYRRRSDTSGRVRVPGPIRRRGYPLPPARTGGRGRSRLATMPMRSSSLPTDTRRGGRLASSTRWTTTATSIGRDPVGLVARHQPEALSTAGRIGIVPPSRARRAPPPAGELGVRRCPVRPGSPRCRTGPPRRPVPRRSPPGRTCWRCRRPGTGGSRSRRWS